MHQSSTMKLLICWVVLCCALQSRALSFDSAGKDFLPSPKSCGKQHLRDAAQKEVQEGEFPWVAFIPLESRVNNPDAHVRCAGALINKRYVIISKSCLQFVMSKIHLGQHDTSKNTSCTASGTCGPVEIREVEQRAIDENIDVVLLRLDKDVEYSDNIQPICLPFDDFKKPVAGATMFTSGWGLTSVEGRNSEIKKKVVHTLISNAECHKSGAIKNADDKNSICIAVDKNGASRACSGDEGSPIMYAAENDRYVLEGVLADVYDPDNTPCANQNPARGIRITDETLQWMIEKMRP